MGDDAVSRALWLLAHSPLAQDEQEQDGNMYRSSSDGFVEAGTDGMGTTTGAARAAAYKLLPAHSHSYGRSHSTPHNHTDHKRILSTQHRLRDDHDELAAVIASLDKSEVRSQDESTHRKHKHPVHWHRQSNSRLTQPSASRPQWSLEMKGDAQPQRQQHQGQEEREHDTMPVSALAHRELLLIAHQLSRKSRELKRREERLRELIDAVTARTQKLAAEQAAFEHTKASAEAAICDARKKLQQQQRELDHTLSARLQVLAQQHELEADAKVRRLEAELQRLRATHTQLRLTASQARAENKRLQEQLHSSQIEVQHRDSRIAALRSSISAATAAVASGTGISDAASNAQHKPAVRTRAGTNTEHGNASDGAQLSTGNTSPDDDDGGGGDGDASQPLRATDLRTSLPQSRPTQATPACPRSERNESRLQQGAEACFTLLSLLLRHANARSLVNRFVHEASLEDKARPSLHPHRRAASAAQTQPHNRTRAALSRSTPVSWAAQAQSGSSWVQGETHLWASGVVGMVNGRSSSRIQSGRHLAGSSGFTHGGGDSSSSSSRHNLAGSKRADEEVS